MALRARAAKPKLLRYPPRLPLRPFSTPFYAPNFTRRRELRAGFAAGRSSPASYARRQYPPPPGSNRVRHPPGPAGRPKWPLRNRGARQHAQPLPSGLARRPAAPATRPGSAEPGQHAARLYLQSGADFAGWHAPQRPAHGALCGLPAHRAGRDRAARNRARAGRGSLRARCGGWLHQHRDQDLRRHSPARWRGTGRHVPGRRVRPEKHQRRLLRPGQGPAAGGRHSQ
jgi:hypothetical protein